MKKLIGFAGCGACASAGEEAASVKSASAARTDRAVIMMFSLRFGQDAYGTADAFYPRIAVSIQRSPASLTASGRLRKTRPFVSSDRRPRPASDPSRDNAGGLRHHHGLFGHLVPREEGRFVTQMTRIARAALIAAVLVPVFSVTSAHAQQGGPQLRVLVEPARPGERRRRARAHRPAGRHRRRPT